MSTVEVLMKDQYAPITSQIGFIEASCSQVEQALVQWQQSLSQRLTIERFSEGFPRSLRRLEPLAVGTVNRELVLTTDSEWTAYFNNAWRGPDTFGAVVTLGEMLGCRGVEIACVPNTLGRANDPRKGRYGAVTLELHNGKDPSEHRAVGVVNDGGRWTFVNIGTLLPFEQSSFYQGRRIKDRFTSELLETYGRALGIRYFDPSFYLAEGSLIRNLTQEGYAHRFMTLDESRAEHNLPPAPGW